MPRGWLRRLWLATPTACRRWLVARIEPRFTVAVVGVFQDPDGRLLLLRHFWHVHGGWALPGGFLRHGEAPEEGLSRELHEETGLRCDRLHLQLVRGVAGGKGMEIVFRGRIVIPEPLRLNSEIVEARWVSPDKLPEPIPAAQKRAIAIALRGGRPSREGGLRESAD